jgi:predicted ATPase
MLISEFEIQSNSDNTDYVTFDEFEMQDIALACLVVESLLTSRF